jgi:hypothetical protein
MKKFFKVLAYIILGLLVSLALLFLIVNEREPQGVEGEEAELLTQKIYASINKTAWDTTEWVGWSFHDDHHYLLDKVLNRVQVRWGDIDVALDLNTQKGIVNKGTHVNIITGEVAEKAVKDAYKMFCNDGFWLMAPYKLTDPGTRRSIVTLSDGRKGLKVTYDSGGTTPGDSYVWIVDEQGTPLSVKLWVSVLPIGGVEATWEKWVKLSNGAKLSTFHLIGGVFKSPITDVEGGSGTPIF